jgi:ABC-type thiamin/hydroxymethylpyrimidine transport system permease subunit
LSLALIALVAFWIRAADPLKSTAYMDETIYVVFGRMFLKGKFESPLETPLHFTFGWYLWPIITATMDRLGGMVAIREFCALAGTATVMAVYGIARRLYGVAVGLGAAGVFALCGPAVMTSRVATRDAGEVFFLSLGLWAFVKAWQDRDSKSWLISAALLYGAFLCKYTAAIFFPLLVVVALWRGLKPLLLFCAPLFLACLYYLTHFWNDLQYLLAYGGAYSSLRAHGHEVWEIYVSRQYELWVIGILALLALAVRERRRVSLLLWAGAAATFVFQFATRADYDFWKTAVYPLLLLCPVAVHGLLVASRKSALTLLRQVTVSILAVAAVAAQAAWAGNSIHPEQNLFWPNVEPVLAYLEGRLPSGARVLADDSVYRYYLFEPGLQEQSQVTDPFYFGYYVSDRYLEGREAYAKAAQDGFWDYIILDGGMGGEAERMDGAIRPNLGRYALRMAMPDPVLRHPLEVYERTNPPAQKLAQGLPSVEFAWPVTNATVDRKTYISGRTNGATPNSQVRIEIFTDRWYQVDKAPLKPDGTFATKFPATFDGQGLQACNHMIRARLYDEAGSPRAVSLAFHIKRAKSGCE